MYLYYLYYFSIIFSQNIKIFSNNILFKQNCAKMIIFSIISLHLEYAHYC